MIRILIYTVLFLAVLLASVFIAGLNAQIVDLHLYFLIIQMPFAFALLCAIVLGVIMGTVLSFSRSSVLKKKLKSSQREVRILQIEQQNETDNKE